MFKMYYADCVGVKNNCLYPHEIDITGAASLEEAAAHDYVCATYTGNYRSNDNFQASDCLAVECDPAIRASPSRISTPPSMPPLSLPTLWRTSYARETDRTETG